MTQKETQTPASRIVELDALRGMAAVAVLACHLPWSFWFGETGVDLFFVLSGFLITGIILRSRDQPSFLRTFYWRRSLRIFPIYYLALAFVYSVNAFRSNPEDMTGFPFYLVYLQRLPEYWGGNFPVIPSLGHTWTLAIEEQFYLFWPIVLMLSRRRAAPWLMGLFVLFPVAVRYFGLPRSVLFAHTDGLALGALLAWLMLTKLAVSFAVAILSWRFIEQPILRFKDYFNYSRENTNYKQPASALTIWKGVGVIANRGCVNATERLENADIRAVRSPD
jgi:peptidoglycan/LPS O-acetylase OafA/YrhL